MDSGFFIVSGKKGIYMAKTFNIINRRDLPTGEKKAVLVVKGKSAANPNYFVKELRLCL